MEGGGGGLNREFRVKTDSHLKYLFSNILTDELKESLINIVV